MFRVGASVPVYAALGFYDQARAAYDFCLANFLYSEAIFFAERIVAEQDDEESKYLLALALFHNQEISRAYARLQSCTLPEARYLLARCCFQMQKWEEADDVLCMNHGLHDTAEVANGAAGLLLLGLVKERQAKREDAMECYHKCLEQCPFMFHAFERLSWWSLSTSMDRSIKDGFASLFFTDERFAQWSILQTAATNAQAGGNANKQLPHMVASAHWGHMNKERKEVVGGSASSANVPHAPFTFAHLLWTLATALHAFHEFDTGQCVQILKQLPRHHAETGWVLELVGRCFFEAHDYRRAEHAFLQVSRVDPRRVSGLEYYSTVLWHLKKDIDCTHLAQQILQWDRLKPEVWCVLGNCFSLQNEHDVAIKFFKRAIQIDPAFCYAYTLCGHEFVSNEKFDNAIPMFEQALSIDPRHYNAWWGLGNIYYRREEYENAQYHFLKALEINKNNSVVKFPEALRDLEKLRALAPKEAPVHYELGKVYMKLQCDKKALLHFNIAMDLNKDSKDYHQIKQYIEKLHVRPGVQNDASVSSSGGNSVGGNDLSRRGSTGHVPAAASQPPNSALLGSHPVVAPRGLLGTTGRVWAQGSPGVASAHGTGGSGNGGMLRFARPSWQPGPGQAPGGNQGQAGQGSTTAPGWNGFRL
eukprot:GEMP01013788.1.p1 GENE.GEMP01013788.1~~GEMP01013788.1.p1  ORF type:complete len:645 (+),score=132.39 GEMP01013788.1:132-2066(+)